MRIDFHGLTFDVPRVTFYLWTPWRCSALEHRLFEAVSKALQEKPQQGDDELLVDLTDARHWRGAWQAVERVIKGWQEEAEAGRERRAYRWLLEAECDAHGYDALGERLSLWFYLRLAVERGGPGEPDKGEDVDLQGFGIRFWGNES